MTIQTSHTTRLEARDLRDLFYLSYHTMYHILHMAKTPKYLVNEGPYEVYIIIPIFQIRHRVQG